MIKRSLSSFLWFLVGWQAGGVLVGLLALPAFLGFVPGIVIAALVWWDPKAMFWTRAPQGRRVMPINDYAAGLERNQDKRIDHWPLVESDADLV